ncbi:hypothetical protein AB1K32_25380 [Metabacillus dongyingensis]|uniref:hypothetical protein n=1 Tax=Metabacillus dongyingensis TaxID=2874282 RepID=UPI003B8E7741
MNEILNMALPLVGVVLGGVITFVIQQSSIRKQQEFEREKIKIDNFYKEEIRKFETYNKILQIDGIYRIHDKSHHQGASELNRDNYNEYMRPVLFDIFHLLDEEIAEEVNNIEDIYERQAVMEEADEFDQEKLSNSYEKIILLIKQQFKKHRESKRNLRSA